MFTNTPITIGAVVTTAGPVARLGSSFVKAIQLAKEELGATRHRYHLSVEEITDPATPRSRSRNSSRSTR